MPVLVFKSAPAYSGAEGDRMRRNGGPAARTPPARGGVDAYFDYRHRMRRPGHFSWPALLSPSGETLQGRDFVTLRKLVW